jgi:hypothetical protein
LHALRYFSQGRPTKLVRDVESDSYDDPPDGAPLPPAVATDPDGEGGEIWQRAEEQYELIVSRPTRARKLRAGALNWTATLLVGALNGPTVVLETADVLSVVDRENGVVALTRRAGSSDGEELGSDLKKLSVRQFRTKWGIRE